QSWIQLVDSFINFERVTGFDVNGTKFTTTSRPEVVAQFMQGARGWSKQWPIGPVNDFITKWRAWWLAHQPAARIEGNHLIRLEKLSEWNGLDAKHGRNGFLMVMGTLLWWGEAVFVQPRSKPTEEQAEWELAVEDVTWVLEHMLRTV
ncbi:hypothetical protein BDZ89DRAFT_918775, partial [Hymenopellis radicata]